jgi:hypothetical protein
MVCNKHKHQYIESALQIFNHILPVLRDNDITLKFKSQALPIFTGFSMENLCQKCFLFSARVMKKLLGKTISYKDICAM